MAITMGDRKAGATRPKRNIASLVGGFVIALGCFVLWLLVTSQIMHTAPTVLTIVSGAVIAGAIGLWIRLADL